MFDRFTDDARKVMGLSRQAAERLGDEAIGPEHVLLGLLGVPGVHRELLARHGGSIDAVRVDVERRVEAARPERPGCPLGQVPFTPDAKRALEAAYGGGKRDVRPWELLLGLAADRTSLAGRLLRDLRLEVDVAPPAAPTDDVPA